jgi:Sortase domain
LTQGRWATPHRAGWPGNAVAVFLLALGIAFIATGVRMWPAAPRDIGTIPPVTAALPIPAGFSAAGPAPSRTAAPFVPARVRVPRIGIDAPVVPVTVRPDGLLAVPSDVRTAGWWSAGARAAAPSGTVVLAGHVDSARQGSGAFFGIRALEPGDRVVLSSVDGRAAAYTVAARRQYPKSALPIRQVFDQDTTPRLVLVTCGGAFDRGTRHYSDNVVIYALPAPS